MEECLHESKSWRTLVSWWLFDRRTTTALHVQVIGIERLRLRPIIALAIEVLDQEQE